MGPHRKSRVRRIAAPAVVAGALLALHALAAAGRHAIRRVDFRNFTYPDACVGEAHVVDGQFSEEIEGSPFRWWFSVAGVVYGDLTGDGEEEAVVLTLCNGGGSGVYSSGTVYTMREGKPVPIVDLPVGDRADGGIEGVEIQNGLLVLTRNDGNGAMCCPEFTVTLTYRVVGNQLVEAAPPVRRKIAQ